MLSRDHSELLTRELELLGQGPGDAAHIEFRLAYDAVRRRQLEEAGDNVPPTQSAVEEAANTVRASYPDFTPDIPGSLDDPPPLRRPASPPPEEPAIQAMLAALHERDATDATDVKWELVPEDKKQELRQKYARNDAAPSADVMEQFKDEVDSYHADRKPQREHRSVDPSAEG
ncbi:MAG: hypothetical protein WD208_11855 [Dehalococcoidia bacterium]